MTSWRERSPGPFSLWARYEPKTWNRPRWPHLDPIAAVAKTGTEESTSPSLPELAPPDSPDVVYLPPIEPERSVARDELAASIRAAGGHALVHLRAGDTVAPLGATPVLDLLEPLAAGIDPEKVELPRGAWVLFPLVAGLAADEPNRRRWLTRLALGEAAAVIAVAVELPPADRRRLADIAGEERWQAIFHGEPPAERAFARAVFESGLAPLPPLPELALPPRAGRNRVLAAWLAEAGELRLRLGKAEGTGEALLAAARRANGGTLDLAALAREGNLGVVDWLDEPARRLISQGAAGGLTGSPADLEQLRREWRGEESPA